MHFRLKSASRLSIYISTLWAIPCCEIWTNGSKKKNEKQTNLPKKKNEKTNEKKTTKIFKKEGGPGMCSSEHTNSCINISMFVFLYVEVCLFEKYIKRGGRGKYVLYWTQSNLVIYMKLSLYIIMSFQESSLSSFHTVCIYAKKLCKWFQKLGLSLSLANVSSINQTS